MRRFFMTTVFAAMFMAASAQAANGKKHFADSAELNITESLDFQSLNISFIPEYNGGAALSYDLGRLRVGSAEVDEVSGTVSPIDGEIDAGIFGSADEKGFGSQFNVELGFDVSSTTVLTAEYRFLEIADSGAPNPHGFVFGARFKF